MRNTRIEQEIYWARCPNGAPLSTEAIHYLNLKHEAEMRVEGYRIDSNEIWNGKDR